jgi:hypothetical protein
MTTGLKLVDTRRLPVTSQALNIFTADYNRIDHSEEEATRLDSIVKRMALILAATNDKTEIDADIARRAIAFGEYQLKVRRKLNPSQAITSYAVCENKIRDFMQNQYRMNPEASFTEARIIDRTGLLRTVGKALLATAFKSVANGELEVDKSGKSWRYRWRSDDRD